MNNQLQLPWVQPCQEITPISTSWKKASCRKIKIQIYCLLYNLDHFSESLSSRIDDSGNFIPKPISREILR
jgi:hypothetical protein